MIDNKLTDETIKRMLEITKENMSQIGLIVDKDSCDQWISNTRKNVKDKNYKYNLILNNGILDGFFQLFFDGQKWFLSEIQFSPNIKKNRAILNFLFNLIEYKELKSYNEIYFYINKQNSMSINTFSHLNPVIVLEKEKTIQYKISRKDAENYLKKFKNCKNFIKEKYFISLQDC